MPLRVAPVDVQVLVEGPFRRRRGPVTGRIWLRAPGPVGDVEFPAARWFDFPVVLLDWWLTALQEAVTRPDREVMTHFMDGPFSLALTHHPPDVVRVRWLESGAPAGEREAPARAFEASLRAAARTVLDECDRQGWHDDDVERLRRVAARPPLFGAI